MTLKPKLSTYIKFKEHIETEQYIKFCFSRRKRSLLDKLEWEFYLLP